MRGFPEIAGGRNCCAADLVGPAREVTECSCRVGDVEHLRLTDRLAHVQSLEARQQFTVALDQIGDPIEQLAASNTRCGAPLAAQLRSGGAHCGIDIGGGRGRDDSQRFFGGGVEIDEGVPV